MRIPLYFFNRAKGGTGNVLSGIIGAALARRMADKITPIERQDQAQQPQLSSPRASDFLNDICVAAAVHVHGLVGDFARDMLHENTVLATDLLDYLSEAFRDCELQMDKALFYLQE